MPGKGPATPWCPSLPLGWAAAGAAGSYVRVSVDNPSIVTGAGPSPQRHAPRPKYPGDTSAKGEATGGKDDWQQASVQR